MSLLPTQHLPATVGHELIEPVAFEVQTLFYCGDFENCWMDGEGNPITFKTWDDAREAIKDAIRDQNEAVENGDMIDALTSEDYRIVALYNN